MRLASYMTDQEALSSENILDLVSGNEPNTYIHYLLLKLGFELKDF